MKVLVVSASPESLYGERVLRAGASGYLHKQESHIMLIEAIRTVLRGQRYLSPELSQRLITQSLNGQQSSQEPSELLSDRELEVFRMIGHGLTSGAIAERLYLSRHTIHTHRQNIKRKIGARDAGELSQHAVRWVLENSSA